MTGANLAVPLTAVATAPVLAQTLGVVGRGEVAAATAPYLLATAVAAFGIPESITHFVARGQIAAGEAVRRSLTFVAVSGGAVMLALIAASGWLSNGDPDLQQLIALGAVATVPALLVGVLRGAAAGMQLWSLVVRDRLVTATLRLVAIIGLAVVGRLTVTTASIVLILTPLVGACSYVRLRRPRHQEPVGTGCVTGATVVSYGVRTWVGAVSGVLLFRLDQAMITPLSNAGELGIYAVAATISEIPLITTRAMRDVTFAADAAGESDDRLAMTARLSGLAALVIGGAVSLTLPLWITRLFGDGFRDALPVAWVLTGAVVLGAPGSIMGAGLSARGRPGLRSAALVAALLVNLALLVLLVPRYGAVGAAVATLVGNASANLIVVSCMWRVFHLSPWPFYSIRRSDLAMLIRLLRRVAGSLGDHPGRTRHGGT